ncbi:hypothetical protein GW17_00058115 [Ensete ventricosum]|nr:hypothetical protein GW17_00058115 [Ensete ventricosum]
MEQCVVTNSRLTRGSIAKISEGDEGKITARFSERQRERERDAGRGRKDGTLLRGGVITRTRGIVEGELDYHIIGTTGRGTNEDKVGKAKTPRKEGGRPRPGPLQGWLAIARPPTGAASYGLATRKGATGCGQGQPTREAGGAHKGRQTPATCRRPPVGAAACRGGDDDSADGANGLGQSF